jgi:TonB-dependent starch-binding outer membrane protein SusC
MKKFLLTCFALAIALSSFAQERTITGKVTSTEDGSSLPGVNVLLKGTTVGTATDADGKFSLAIPSTGGALIFSFIGLESKEVEIGDRTVVDVSLALDVTQLTEVVVVGYGTQAKRDLTGSIASITGKDIAAMPIQSFDQALQGRAAGVQITTPNGVLNNPPIIRIRGVNSISLSSFPLVVIDGVPTYSGDQSTTSAANNPLSNLNPNDIESIQVLKDASASAIYGSRATAGVILITTKRGSKGKSRLTYDSWVGWTKPTNLIDVLNAQEYMDHKNEAVRNLNDNQNLTGQPNANREGFLPSYDADGNLVDTDWYKYVYQTGFSHSNSISISGGSDQTTYYMSVGHTAQKGIVKTNEFKRSSFRVNLDHKMLDRVTFGTNFAFANNWNFGPNTGSLPGQAFSTAGVGRLPIVLPPNTPVYNPDGSYHTSGAGLGPGANINPTIVAPAAPTALAPGYYNPKLILDKNKQSSESNQFQGSVYANIEIIKGLNLRTSFGVDVIGYEDLLFYTGLGGDGYSANGQAINAYRTNKRWVQQNTLQYDKKIAENHNISVLVGHEEQYTKIDRWGANRTTLGDIFYETYQGTFTNIAAANNLQTENYLLSYFSRVNYDFKKKYFLSFNGRRDGYSAWEQKWGNFYGGSLGYAISEESFWNTNGILSNLNFFKIKASYGQVGNSQGASDFGSLQTYGGGLYGAIATLAYTQAGNTALSWETSKKTDVGFEFGILQDRIQGEFAYYENLVDGLILNVPQAPSKGIPGNAIFANVGSMINTGIEFSIKFNAIRNSDFNWTVSANFTTLKNEVLTLTGQDNERIPTATSGLETVNFTEVGQPAGYIRVMESGVNPLNGRRTVQKADGTVAQYNHSATAANGGGWTDVATGLPTSAPSQLVDGKIYNSLPTYYGGFDNNFSYKNFDLGLFLQFSGGNYIYNGTKAGLHDQRFWNNAADMTDHWTPENPNAKWPRPVYGDNVSNGSALAISENVEKGDFVRLRNVSLGYSIPKSLLEKVKISSARVYVQGQNIFTITDYTGFDPEISVNGNSNTGSSVDRNSVGMAKTFTAGINIGF